MLQLLGLPPAPAWVTRTASTASMVVTPLEAAWTVKVSRGLRFPLRDLEGNPSSLFFLGGRGWF